MASYSVHFLTADVIVGFPAEDDDAFERTVETVRAATVTEEGIRAA